MKKNFSKQPNDFLLDEKQEHDLTAYIKSPLQKLIIIVMEGCSMRFGGEFQKSANQLAKMCMVTRKTFIDNIEILINQGLISKRVIDVEGTKEKEATYWTVNFEYQFEEMEDANENKATLDKNYTTVGENLYNGSIEIIQKKDVLKDVLKDFDDDDIYKHWLNISEMANMKDFLRENGFKSDIINDIANKTANKIINKEITFIYLKKSSFENAFKAYLEDYEKPNINSLSGLFVYKLKEACQKAEIKLKQNNLQKSQENSPSVPFYNWLEA